MTTIALTTGFFANDNEMNDLYIDVIKIAAKQYNEYMSTKDKDVLAAYKERVKKIAKMFDIEDVAKVLVDVVAVA